jgi:hypothetical protein
MTACDKPHLDWPDMCCTGLPGHLGACTYDAQQWIGHIREVMVPRGAVFDIIKPTGKPAAAPTRPIALEHVHRVAIGDERTRAR